MLNYKDLSKKLDSFLAGQTREVLESWLEMDRQRMALAITNKVPQTFQNRECGVIRPQTKKNLHTFKQVFLILLFPNAGLAFIRYE